MCLSMHYIHESVYVLPRRAQLPSAERLYFVNVARRGQESPEQIDAHSILICSF